MENKRIEKLIVKFISKAITAEELTELSQWLEFPKNKALFKEYIQINYALDYHFSEVFNTESSGIKIQSKIVKNQKKGEIISFRKYTKYIAAAVILFSFSLLFKWGLKTEKGLSTIKTTILPGKDKAILTLADGRQVSLEKGNKYASKTAKSNGENLIYHKNTPKKATKIAYNYLTIPRGGQFFIQLADGTKVWLNSDSALKYPVRFVEGQTRKVELLYGEAYFEVSHSDKHKGATFQVKTNEQYVTVFGTQFNIEAYKGENTIATTLVKGKVSISNGVTTKKLQPGMQSKVDHKTHRITLVRVDVAYAIAWKNGAFLFKKEPLANIMEVLSRWYNVKVVFKNPLKKQSLFSGRLNRIHKIDELLKSIQQTGEVTFKIAKDTITIE